MDTYLARDRNRRPVAPWRLMVVLVGPIAAVWIALEARPAGAGVDTLEYRLEVSPGQGPSETFQWRDGSKSLELELHPFLTTSDFQTAKVVSAGLNTPGRYSVELIHTKSGAKKYREVADKDRERQFSILVDGKIVQSYSFPPEQKGVHDRGNTIYGPFTKAEAVTLVRRINAEIRAHGRPRTETPRRVKWDDFSDSTQGGE
ncbi:MAG: hypothetical protein HYS05_14495 [Acidobacteria bacterium]|nr:hypothetical protein [Acidobacteriota bacterium]